MGVKNKSVCVKCYPQNNCINLVNPQMGGNHFFNSQQNDRH